MAMAPRLLIIYSVLLPMEWKKDRKGLSFAVESIYVKILPLSGCFHNVRTTRKKFVPAHY
jgi:hypothetical protein